MIKYEIENGEVTITGYTDKSVESINIPEFIDNLPVTNIGHSAFCCCTSLTEIIIHNSVTNIGNHAFYYCNSLNEIIIPNSVTNIGNHAFYDCTSLKKIIIPNSVTNIGDYAFSNCNSLTEINGVKLKEGINLINNRFIFYKRDIFKIKHQISGDFISEDNIIFINGKIFNS